MEGCLGTGDARNDLFRIPDGIKRRSPFSDHFAAVCLWVFAIRGRRRYLLVLTALVGVIIWQSSSGMLRMRLNGTFDEKEDTASAYDSAMERQQLFWRSIEVTEEHPLFGVGPGNFQVISGMWLVTHNSFTE